MATTMCRVFVWVACATVLFSTAGTASAQYGVVGPGSAGVTGEDYHVELSYALWLNPDREIIVSSESLGIIGSEIDAVVDLGFEAERFNDFKIVLRPTRKFKFRFGYTPIRYEGDTVLTRTIVFNGQRYDIGVPVVTDFDWKLWRFGIQWDFISRSRGFAGLILEVKYNDLDITITSPIVAEYTRVKVPVPTIGGIARVYPTRSLALTFEMTGLKATIDEDTGQYFDFDINGTYNLGRNFGVQAGYRSVDVEYDVDDDFGHLELSGFYIGGVARF